MGFLLIMKAEIVRSFIIMRRYWFRTLVGLALSYGMLMVLALGVVFSQADDEKPEDGKGKDRIERSDQANGGASGETKLTPREKRRAERRAKKAEQEAAKANPKGFLGLSKEDANQGTNWLLGFIIGVFAFGIVGMFTQGLQGMARTGVLEQLCMSPHGLIKNFLARTAVASISTIMSSAITVWLVAITVGGELHFSALPVLALLVLTFTNLLGFGFMVGGLVLVFKQVGQVALIVRMVLFALAIFATEDLLDNGWVLAGIMHALPITDAAICLKLVLLKGVGTDIFSHACFYWLILSCVCWTVIGMVCFRFMEDWSRSKGTLGAY